MALTIGNFIGFETGGLEEAMAIANTPTIDSSLKKNGTYSVQLNSSSDMYAVYPFTVASAGNYHILKFWLYLDDTTPTGEAQFLNAVQGASRPFRLYLEADGDVHLRDSGFNIIATATTPFSNGQWHLVEIGTQKASLTIDKNLRARAKYRANHWYTTSKTLYNHHPEGFVGLQGNNGSQGIAVEISPHLMVIAVPGNIH